ncbi:hypothetical protein N7447_008824 [Penicillium robsamsonii]|uniref:uncharacterized protein n=1 Tax=Penicillium robsamsonii TaxID=1792511 RepID=UPI0025470E7E|nr:uncharacterized protein N7447_008824 [Penicillium robsamsonii]KAJ5816591.1 hypothetical protein N7447_008824 [Penicillium robsamsonii]
MEDTNNQSPRPGGPPPSRQTILPPPPGQGDDMLIAPGLWAVHIQKLPFRVARQGEMLQGRYLNILNAMSNQREPCLRRGINLTAQEFQKQMNDSLPRVEAALMQVVGNQNELECTRCLELIGKFSHCVSVRGIDGLSACANCHWAERDHLCQYIRNLPTLTQSTAGFDLMDPPQSSSSTNTQPTAQHMNEHIRLLNGHIKLMQEQVKLCDQAQRLGTQLERLRNELTATNTATITNEQPMQQTINEICASQRELYQGIRRSMMHILNMMNHDRQTSPSSP